MKCPVCFQDNPDSSRFCGNCGSAVDSDSGSAGTPHTRTITTWLPDIKPGTIFAEKYEILAELGRGGMGVVFKAQDSRLKRTVAIKTLLPHILIQPDDQSRFEREARSAAALNHPNICTVYEIDEAEGVHFIAMEYVEGQTLKNSIEIRPLPFDDVIDYAVQIAEGLKHAHDRGIIHRDIKASNIMVSAKKEVKITDFGLAKPTGSTVITREGTTVGTTAYMSPEQLSGKPVDYGTDIWSLGVVLFEITTGILPFRGEYDQALIHSILTVSPPPVTGMRSGIPLEWEQVVNRCLEKDSGLRYQSASDLLADLRRLRRDWEAGRLVVSEGRAAGTLRRSRPVLDPLKNLALVAAPLLAGALLYLIFLHSGGLGTRPPLAPMNLRPFTSGNGLALSPSWSPDGEWITFASDRSGSMDIWKRPVGGGELQQLTFSPGDERQPDWSPDGRSIAFATDQGIYLVSAGGGSPSAFCDFGNNPTWAPDSTRLAFDRFGDIYVVDITTKSERAVVTGTTSTPYMEWTPDGMHLLYWNRTKGDLHICNVSSGDSRSLGWVPAGQEISGITCSLDGRTLLVSLGPFGGSKDLWLLRLSGSGDRITITDSYPISYTATEDIQCALSPDGTSVAFIVSEHERHLWQYPLDPRTGLVSGEGKQLTHDSSNNYYPSLSPDQTELVWTAHITEKGALCLLDLESGEESKVTPDWDDSAREVGGSFGPDGQLCYASTLTGSYQVYRLPNPGGVGLPLTETQGSTRDTMTTWSPDGKGIAFYSNRSGNWDIWTVTLNDQHVQRKLTEWESNEMYPSWSPDSSTIAFWTDRDGNGDIWIMNADGSNPRPYVSHLAVEGWSAWSPDSRRFYFTSNRSGAFNVWMRATGEDEVLPVTIFPGQPVGLPESELFTKFAVTDSFLVVPLQTRTGNIYILENLR
ncbi:MAG: protein kinase [Candidatus Aminicenantaceae bacterium]